MPDATPIASWPRHLQASWRDCVERGEVDAQNPPATAREAHRLLVEAQLRQMQDVAQLI